MALFVPAIRRKTMLCLSSILLGNMRAELGGINLALCPLNRAVIVIDPQRFSIKCVEAVPNTPYDQHREYERDYRDRKEMPTDCHGDRGSC
jgi:hypothetical protein